MALAAEAGELLEQFQWLTPEESDALPDGKLRAVSHEMADVFIYLVRLSDVLGVDLEEVTLEKVTINEAKYPAEKVRGSARKSTEYE
jgi:NTP pyrophosphatase (non-canonical NTP hydrolase)